MTFHFRYSKLDQENLLHQVREWQRQSPEDNFEIELATEPSDEKVEDVEDVENEQVDDDDEVQACESNGTSFFFCHQSKFQRHLLKR